MADLKIKKIGENIVLIPSKDALDVLGCAEGDRFLVSQTSDGFKLKRMSDKVAAQVEVGLSIIDRYSETLEMLAKS